MLERTRVDTFMKKILVSAGSLSLAAAALHAAYAPGLSSMERSKPWSVTALVHGFYDDNYTTSPKVTPVPTGPASFSLEKPKSSFGLELSPALSLNLPFEQTFLSLSYVYSMKYYENRVHFHQASADHSHQFNAALKHQFNERYKMEVTDQFVIAQEPEILNPVGIASVPLRVTGNNIRNSGTVMFSAQMTQELSTDINYGNNIYRYDQTNYSASLDRMEHSASVNLRYQWLPQTVAILGYQFGLVDYSDSGSIGTTGFVASDIRNNRSHYVYVGAEQNFSTQLNASLRVGGQYIDYYNVNQNSISPYADATLNYQYAPGSTLTLGIRHSHAQSDINTILDTESTMGYVSLTHRITSLLSGNFMVQYQNSNFNEKSSTKGIAGLHGSDDYFIASMNLQYRIDQAGHWIGEVGYNFDKLSSDERTATPAGVFDLRSYERNRVYLGIRATY